uniref:Uncharacterized protein n=1 Tax=Mus spicilegus TaxID=10103 RepID=A0A8C6H980_MUSSI
MYSQLNLKTPPHSLGSVAHLVRATPFNAPHLQLVQDGLSGPRSPPGLPRHSSHLAAAIVEEYSCESGSVKWLWWGLKLWSDTHCCSCLLFDCSHVICEGCSSHVCCLSLGLRNFLLQ